MDPEKQISRLIETTQSENLEDEAKLMQKLRLIKAEAAMIIALADLAKTWDTLKITHVLTLIAQAALSAAIKFTLREAAITGKIELSDIRNPERCSGWIFLGMGKMGAYELNYSSDIDLIVLFDRRHARLLEPDADTEFFVKMTKRVVKIINDHTESGYVFRIDLRLRPDPSATPIALPLEAAMNYYESMGQNWERAAFIKSRPVAGDLQAGEAFLKELAPFIWRKTSILQLLLMFILSSDRFMPIKVTPQLESTAITSNLAEGVLERLNFCSNTTINSWWQKSKT